MPSDLSGWLTGNAAPYWIGAGMALCVAIAAGIGDWRRRQRTDLDRVGWIDWPTLQIVALIAAAACVTIAVHD